MFKLYQVPVTRTERELEAKRIRLVELEERYEGAVGIASRASFKGKITRCKHVIQFLEERIEAVREPREATVNETTCEETKNLKK